MILTCFGSPTGFRFIFNDFTKCILKQKVALLHRVNINNHFLWLKKNFNGVILNKCLLLDLMKIFLQ
ncbi:unnamed protein product [Paramecium sonneborni]|uniref:Uncharacterized protein n=1 Tax=Paramecium sonneborni TaxID=65129 RepID=A0A8S1LPB7_9CILI|nr:unnamed protein product [Paramecium sonneborni]